MNMTKHRKLAIIRCANACEDASRLAYAHGGDATVMGAYWLQVATDWSRIAFSHAWHLPTRRPSPTRKPRGHTP